MVIFQPRPNPAYPISESIITPAELLVWATDELIPAVWAAKELDAPFKPSEKACMWCRHKPKCPAAYERTVALAQVEFKDFSPPKPTSLSDEQLAQIVRHGAEITKYIKAVSEYAKAHMEQGGLIPGYKLVPGRRSARKWIDEEVARKFLIRKVGKDNLFDFKIKSPAKIEQLLKGGKHSIDGLTEQKAGSPTIASEDDKRDAIISTAALAFQEFATKKE